MCMCDNWWTFNVGYVKWLMNVAVLLIIVFWCSSDLKSSVRKLEHENADLRFLNNQYVHKMRSLELDSKQKMERILQLQEKNFHAVVQTPGVNQIL